MNWENNGKQVWVETNALQIWNVEVRAVAAVILEQKLLWLATGVTPLAG